MYRRCGASMGPNIRSVIGDKVGSTLLSLSAAAPAIPIVAAVMDSFGVA